MNLKDFIRETLTQIVEGISAANTEVKTKGALVNPAKVQINQDERGPYARFVPDLNNSAEYQAVELIDFDVVVTTAESSTAKGGVGLHVGVIGIGGSKGAESGNSSESRVKFKVPMLLPVSKHS